MKFEVVRQRVRMRRESNVKHELPYDDFLNKTDLAERLVDFTEQQNADQEIKQEARKYLVIICVSAMDIYFAEMTGIFVQESCFEDTLLDILRQNKISLADLVEMDKEKMTLGEIVSVSQSFQNLDSINDFYSKMLGCKDFIEELSEFGAPLGKSKYSILKNDRPEFRKDIIELVRLRHLIVHHKLFGIIIDAKKLVDMVESLVSFVYAAEFYLMNAYRKYIRA